MSTLGAEVSVVSGSPVTIDAPNQSLGTWIGVQFANVSTSLVIAQVGVDQIMLGPQTITFIPLGGGTLSAQLSTASTTAAQITPLWFSVGNPVPSGVQVAPLNTGLITISGGTVDINNITAGTVNVQNTSGGVLNVNSQQISLFSGNLDVSSASIGNTAITISEAVHAVSANFHGQLILDQAISGLTANTDYAVQIEVAITSGSSVSDVYAVDNYHFGDLFFYITTDANGDVATGTAWTLVGQIVNIPPRYWLYTGSANLCWQVQGYSGNGFSPLPGSGLPMHLTNIVVTGYQESVPPPGPPGTAANVLLGGSFTTGSSGGGLAIYGPSNKNVVFTSVRCMATTAVTGLIYFAGPLLGSVTPQLPQYLVSQNCLGNGEMINPPGLFMPANNQATIETTMAGTFYWSASLVEL